MQKKILFLGAGVFQIPPIKYAKQAGYYVITCDNQPANPGHQYANESYNISTIDKEAVLKLAKEKAINGIVAYASDVSAPTAAFVGNRLGLPSNPYNSVKTLVYKDLFRKFMENNNFKTVESEGFTEQKMAATFFDKIQKPAIIKPVDSSGTKGISKIYQLEEFQVAWEYAYEYSISKRIVVEEFIERKGFQVAGDGFLVDGELVFRAFANEHFDKNGHPLVPIGESYPSSLSTLMQAKAHEILQNILSKLDMRIGALNFDFMVNKNGEIFILEIGPRNGGNLIPEVTKFCTGIDMIKATVEIALNHDCSDIVMVEPRGWCSTYIIHSNKNGIFKGISFSEEISRQIVHNQTFLEKGDNVMKFNNASLGAGALIINFDSEKDMLDKMDNMERHIKVELE